MNRIFCPSVLLAIACLAVISGCGQDLETIYGQRSGIGESSVNGTGVLAKMFESAGHRVFSWRALSPRLKQRADCIVWFPNDFKPPSREVQKWLEGWLEEKPNRTLIYVGRDYDAAAPYWAAVLPGAPAGQQMEIRLRKTAAEAAMTLGRKDLADGAKCDWFAIDAKSSARKVTTLDGTPEWTDGIDPSQAEIELNSRLVPSDDADALLESGDDVLVSRLAWHDSQVIVVANGSFLLNYPLVNHEDRKLAGRLVNEIGRSGQTVVFLESGVGGPPIRDDDSIDSTPSGLEVFNLWPTGVILLHFAAAGIILCFSRWPIFGRPREPAPEPLSDFGKHVQAVGEMLERSGDAAYARARLAQYRQMVDNKEG